MKHLQNIICFSAENQQCHNWLQRDATVCLVWLFPAGWHRCRDGTLCTPPGEDQPQGQIPEQVKARVFWLSSESGAGIWISEVRNNRLWAGTKSHLELQCHVTASPLPGSAFMVLYPLSPLGDLHLCLSIQRLINVIHLYWAHDTYPALPFTQNKEYFETFPHHLFSWEALGANTNTWMLCETVAQGFYIWSLDCKVTL